MAGNPVLLKVDGERLVQALQEVREKLDGAAGEVVLDFSSVRRVDPRALRAMEDLVRAADDRESKVVLRKVNVEVYRVLKLMQLAPRFSYLP